MGIYAILIGFCWLDRLVAGLNKVSVGDMSGEDVSNGVAFIEGLAEGFKIFYVVGFGNVVACANNEGWLPPKRLLTDGAGLFAITCESFLG